MTPPNKIFPLREGPIETTESCRAPDLLHTRVEAADAVHACDITNVSWSPIQTCALGRRAAPRFPCARAK